MGAGRDDNQRSAGDPVWHERWPFPSGGVLTGLFGWPAVFFVNVPIVAALAALALLVLPEGRPSSAGRFDLPGALLVTLAAMTIVDTLVPMSAAARRTR
jgi:hypothetical protein